MSDYILPEVVTEILKRLPVKSLLRFRSVCKDWLSLISSPDFISQHLSHSSSSHTLVRHYSKLHSKEIYTLFSVENSTRITFPGNSTFYSRVVGYCNGVLCLSDDLFGYKETIILWNPSIRRAINVPAPRVTNASYGSYMFALGFGFDCVSNDYKIVRVAYLWSDGYKFPPKVEVFSVSLGKWRFVKNGMTNCITEHLWSQAVRDGIVHWIGFNGDVTKQGRNLIVTFDLSTEKFGELDLPRSLVNESFTNMRIAMLNGSVSVLSYQDKPMCGGCSVWVMKDYGNSESWYLEWCIKPEQSVLIGILRNDRLVLAHRDGELALISPMNSTATCTEIYGTRFSFFVDEYVESLVLMGKGREVRGRNQEPDFEIEDESVEAEENKQLHDSYVRIMVGLMKISMT